MTTHAAVQPGPSVTGPRSPRLVPLITISVLVATALNLGLYAIGRITEATFLVDNGHEPNHLVILPDVVWKTMAPVVVGAIVLVLIARYSRRLTTLGTIAGTAVGVGTGFLALGNAHDMTTGVLLLGMHTTTAIAYLVIGAGVRRSAPTRRRDGVS